MLPQASERVGKRPAHARIGALVINRASYRVLDNANQGAGPPVRDKKTRTEFLYTDMSG